MLVHDTAVNLGSNGSRSMPFWEQISEGSSSHPPPSLMNAIGSRA